VINLRDLKHFQQGNYCRNLVLRTDNMEIIVVCWLPGQGSPVHGHGPSDAVMVILEGTMSYTNFYPDGKKVSGIWQTGDIGHAPVGVEHQISNLSDAPLVTLHVYSPPLKREDMGYDLGYANEVQFEEVQLSEEVIKFLRAASPFADGVPNYSI
jgi:quercetin dioxygenase-like cupin family protein